jgi:hypothetical protein
MPVEAGASSAPARQELRLLLGCKGGDANQGCYLGVVARLGGDRAAITWPTKITGPS